jgi:hypothetical protein
MAHEWMAPMSQPTSNHTLPWRYGVSNAFKGIYVMRYLIFAGGLAIALAVLERTFLKSEHPVMGLVIGFIAGLLMFRSQLRPLFWPTLVLSQQSLYLLRRKHALALPWSNIRTVSEQSGRVALQLAEPMTSPEGQVVEQLQLDPRTLGTKAASLLALIQSAVQSTERRSQLPTDAHVRRAVGLGAPA